MAGATGANLKKRIEEILDKRTIQKLDRGKQLLLAGSAVIATLVPAAIGVVNAPLIRGQESAAGAPAFEVASVRTSNPQAKDVGAFKSKDGNGGGGVAAFQIEHKRFSVVNVNLLQLIVRAYGVKGCPPGPRIVDCPLLSGGPSWVKKDTFDIQAKIPDDSPEYTTVQFLQGDASQVQLMLQALLMERFSLKARREKRQLSVYALTAGKNRPKLKTAEKGEAPFGPVFRPVTQANGETTIEMIVRNRSMQEVADIFAQVFNRPVLDRTGLRGRYDFTMEYEGNADQPGPFTELTGPGLFTAFREQAGLKLEATKAPIEVVVIDRAERPSEN